MDVAQTFDSFLVNQAPAISVSVFAFNFALASILSFVLRKIYLRYGTVLSNRDKFSRNFFMLTTTTMLIITIVKSSLALSLGLVGALSIVRFRAAIKEPEELAYLFLSIATGLGFGAGQTWITLVGFFLITGVLVVFNRSNSGLGEGVLLSFRYSGERLPELKEVVDILQKYVSGIKLKKWEQEATMCEAMFALEVQSFESVDQSKQELSIKYPGVSVLFLDDKGLT